MQGPQGEPGINGTDGRDGTPGLMGMPGKEVSHQGVEIELGISVRVLLLSGSGWS